MNGTEFALTLMIVNVFIEYVFTCRKEYITDTQLSLFRTSSLARSQIRASEGKQTGEGMALAGLIISYIQLIAFIISAIGFAVGIEMLLDQ